MPYDPKAIANFFLEVAESQNQALTPMKLQKLVYFAHGWHLAIKDASLIDEQVEAWSYGPVIRSLYKAFRDYGDQPIQAPAVCHVTVPGDAAEDYYLREVVPSLADDARAAESTRAFLERIWQIYGCYTAIQLSNLTHEPGSPWSQVMREYDGKPPKGTDIPRERIQDYFRRLAQPASQAS